MTARHPVPSAAVRLYRTLLHHLVPVHVQTRRFIEARLAASGQAGMCLDVGAGAGPFAATLGRVLPGVSYVAVDLIPRDHTDVAADAARLPFPDGSAAMVTLFQVLQHVSHPDEVLAEARRVLVPGGQLLISYPTMQMEGRDRDLWRWTRAGMEAQMARAGLPVVDHVVRGGLFLCATSLLAGLPGRLLIGGGEGWRWGQGSGGRLRIALAFGLALPFHILGFAALIVDAVLGLRPVYVGGILLARKPHDA